MMLSHTQFLIKEQVAFLKLTDTYDIYDPDTQVLLGQAVEHTHPALMLLRLVLNKQFLPSTVIVRDAQGNTIFSIKKSPMFLRATVEIFDGNGKPAGYFKSKIFTFGGAFDVFDAANREVAKVKGDWVGWNFQFISPSGSVLGTVTKKWAGIGKEFFTTADTYLITISGEQPHPAQSILLLAAGLAVDIVYKEKK
jgi:uncharacterized protein YxjI